MHTLCVAIVVAVITYAEYKYQLSTLTNICLAHTRYTLQWLLFHMHMLWGGTRICVVRNVHITVTYRAAV